MPTTRCTPHDHLGDLFVPAGAEKDERPALGREDRQRERRSSNYFIYIRGYTRDLLDLVGYTAGTRCPVFQAVETP